MTDFELRGVNSVYFIGIGGISMSGLAMILKSRGYEVSGSDSKESPITDKLSSSGVAVFIGQKTENIPKDVGLVVYTAAIPADNPEMLEVKRRQIPLIPRSKLLGIIMGRFEHSVAVAGTHGKTTTTAMISQILINAGLDPTISIGGVLPSIDSNIRIGRSGYFITEACEYTNSFLELCPTVAVVLNIELDHIDYFRSLDEVYASFKGFVSNVAEGGAVVVNSGIETYGEIVDGKNVITSGFKADDDWTAENVVFNKEYTQLDLCHRRKLIGSARLPLLGEHNVSNALAACATAHFLGVPETVILESVNSFSGAKRRFEFIGARDGFDIYDDYAHHPSEIRATLNAARSRAGDGRIWCVFQPHTYTRTRAFLNEFSESFKDADFIILSDIYAAREKDPGDISSKMLMSKLNDKNAAASYFPDFSSIAGFLGESCRPGDMVLTMGAGDIYMVGQMLLSQ